jgi:hypothetical protein
MNKNGVDHVIDQDDSETSFAGDKIGLLDRLGVKIDDTLHRIFEKYGFSFTYSIKKFIFFCRLVSVDFVLIIRNIQLYL